jgi:hypothetical protein
MLRWQDIRSSTTRFRAPGDRAFWDSLRRAYVRLAVGTAVIGLARCPLTRQLFGGDPSHRPPER